MALCWKLCRKTNAHKTCVIHRHASFIYFFFVLYKCLAGEGIAKNKRLKLEYEELLPSNNSANEMWNKLLTNESLIDKDDLIDAVKFGM